MITDLAAATADSTPHNEAGSFRPFYDVAISSQSSSSSI